VKVDGTKSRMKIKTIFTVALFATLVMLCVTHDGGGQVLHEAEATVFIPQIVHIQWTQGAIDLMMQDHFYTLGDGRKVKVYEKFNGTTNQLKEAYAAKIRAFFPSDVNIRFITEPPVHDYFVKKLIIDETVHQDENGAPTSVGRSPTVPRNITCNHAPSQCFLGTLFHTLQYRYKNYEFKEGTFWVFANPLNNFPVNADRMLSALALCGTHEIGHSLGLVANEFFHVHENGSNHNPEINKSYIMNIDHDYFDVDFFTRTYEWKPLNHKYLKFILPKTLEAAQGN